MRANADRLHPHPGEVVRLLVVAEPHGQVVQVSANIADVQRGASETGTSSSRLLASAQSLSGDSQQLKTELVRFLGSVRAA